MFNHSYIPSVGENGQDKTQHPLNANECVELRFCLKLLKWTTDILIKKFIDIPLGKVASKFSGFYALSV